MNEQEIRDLVKDTHVEISEDDFQTITGGGVCEFEVDGENSLFFKPKEKFPIKIYLKNAEANWEINNIGVLRHYYNTGSIRSQINPNEIDEVIEILKKAKEISEALI